MLSGNWWPFCLGLNVLRRTPNVCVLLCVTLVWYRSIIPRSSGFSAQAMAQSHHCQAMVTQSWRIWLNWPHRPLRIDSIIANNYTKTKLCMIWWGCIIYVFIKFSWWVGNNTRSNLKNHCSDAIMNIMMSLITVASIVYPAVYSGADPRKYQSSASLAFVTGINWWPVNSLHKGSVTWKMFPFDDVIVFWGYSVWPLGYRIIFLLSDSVFSSNITKNTCTISFKRLTITLNIILEYLLL